MSHHTRPSFGFVAVSDGYIVDHPIQITVAATSRDTPSLADVSPSVFGCVEMFMPEGFKPAVPEWLSLFCGRFDAALKVIDLKQDAGRIRRRQSLFNQLHCKSNAHSTGEFSSTCHGTFDPQ
jgi:hypothetical protein